MGAEFVRGRLSQGPTLGSVETTSMMSFKKDLMRTTPNHSGDMSNPDVKIALVYPPPLEKDGTVYQCQQRKSTNYG